MDTLKQYVSRLPLGADNDTKPKVDAKSGLVTVPGVDVIKETVLLRAKVAGGASDRFLKSHKQDLAAIDEAINQLVTKTCEVVQAHLADCAAKLLSSFQHACSRTTLKAFEAASKTFSSNADHAALPGLQPEVYLKGLLSKEALDQQTEQYQDFKNGVDVLRSALGLVASRRDVSFTFEERGHYVSRLSRAQSGLIWSWSGLCLSLHSDEGDLV